mmetsp:Transcript_17208/g.22377  ORF Transcript_17208/g.22377 Transcript_17208/m.22377 type:complete len:114 (+) Transcript_17208:140-481(+)
MRSAVQRKKRLYNEACEDLRASFTPLVVCTVDGVFHRDFVGFQKRVAARLATKWQRPYSVVCNFVRVRLRLQFAKQKCELFERKISLNIDHVLLLLFISTGHPFSRCSFSAPP